MIAKMGSNKMRYRKYVVFDSARYGIISPRESYMLIALDENGDRIIARKADKKCKYFCQECGEVLFLRNGEIRRPHFAHKKESNCPAAHCNKTEWHYEWQEAFGLEYAERVIEAGGFKHIADVLMGDTVIEFQHSRISREDVIERNTFYRYHGLNTIWIFDCRKNCEEKLIFPYEERNGYNWLFEWYRPKKEVIAAGNDAIVFLQVSDNCLLEITWRPEGYDDRGERYWVSLKKFAANIMDKKHAIEKIKKSANLNAEPRLVTDPSMLDELIDMAQL